MRGTPVQVLKALDDWMQRQESLSVQRYFSSERIIWEARRDIVGMVRRTVSGRGYALARATDVAATAIALDERRVLVRLDAHRKLTLDEAVPRSPYPAYHTIPALTRGNA